MSFMIARTLERRAAPIRAAVALTVLLITAGYANADAGAPITKLERKDEPTAIRTWLYAGMFPSTDLVQPDQNGPRRTGYDTDFLTAIGGEAAARPHEGTKITAPTGTVEFKRRTWNTNYIDLTEVFGRPERVCAYLYAEVESPKDTSLFLHFGSNDAGKVWIGNKLVAARPTDGSAQRSQSVTAVDLRAGRNPVLVKVDQAGGNWGAYVEFWDKASSLAPASVAIGGGMSDQIEFGMVRGIIRDVGWWIAGVAVVTTLLTFGWIPLVFWFYFRSRNRHEQREHALRMAMVAKGVPPVVETAVAEDRPRARGRWLVVWGFLLMFVGLGLTIAEVADSGLRNAGFELGVMLAGIGLLLAAEYLRRTGERGNREEEPPARPNDAS